MIKIGFTKQTIRKLAHGYHEIGDARVVMIAADMLMPGILQYLAEKINSRDDWVFLTIASPICILTVLVAMQNGVYYNPETNRLITSVKYPTIEYLDRVLMDSVEQELMADLEKESKYDSMLEPSWAMMGLRALELMSKLKIRTSRHITLMVNAIIALCYCIWEINNAEQAECAAQTGACKLQVG